MRVPKPPTSLPQQSYHTLSVKWQQPDLGKIKINTDAAFKDARSAASVVARDNRGIPKLLWVGKQN